MSSEYRTTFLTRNARFLWLGALLMVPGLAFAAYDVTPHEEIWHDVLYSLFCVPLFCFWLLALLGCVLSFTIHRTLRRS